MAVNDRESKKEVCGAIRACTNGQHTVPQTAQTVKKWQLLFKKVILGYLDIL
jgi:hypothetical protein